ncbi:hypothetical protein DYBT9275_03344 [Dyadobacter sp. CECT 9275]|uniref:Uncharacterized protein n=1 Tax=Dyadobacter helix TaxID=2822344 RepID=A0A916JDA0_9BACT|nr:hypothetical protein [Dyadobacter sp. CECT 9275]CAG5004309.1 hypothetical protein DYBT9275_03344 [Dyadobacter sp. CECT 9275]
MKAPVRLSEKVNPPLRNAFSYARDLFYAGPEGPAGKGLELGLSTVLGQTILRRLPVPFNVVAPFVAEKIIMKHGVEEGRNLLIKGLRWVKSVTEEKPVELPQ